MEWGEEEKWGGGGGGGFRSPGSLIFLSVLYLTWKTVHSQGNEKKKKKDRAWLRGTSTDFIGPISDD